MEQKAPFKIVSGMPQGNLYEILVKHEYYKNILDNMIKSNAIHVINSTRNKGKNVDGINMCGQKQLIIFDEIKRLNKLVDILGAALKTKVDSTISN